MKYVLGVDGGNTKTIALIARLDGTIVGWGRSGNGDIYGAGVSGACASIVKAVRAALRMARCKPKDLLAGGFSMAGADWPDDFALLQEFLEDRRYGATITVVNDSVGALRAGSLDFWGVAIACGTGAATSARSPSGSIWHSSWWQPQGGALALGERAVRAVLDAEVGLAKPTLLTELILAHLQLETVEQLLYAATKRVTPRLAKHMLARVVLDAAQRGDEVACRIVREEGHCLGDFAVLAAKKVGIAQETFPLVFAGSVFRHECTLLIDSILERVRLSGFQVTPIKSELEPAAGALLLAIAKADLTVDEACRAVVRKTAPERSVFAT